MELLVTIGIIAVLLGLLLPVLSAVKTAGRQTLEMAAARQIMAAYTMYANTNKDWVLPGYADGLPAWDANGDEIAGLEGGTILQRRYPWRLASYLDYQFAGLYINGQGEKLEEFEQSDYANYVYVVSLYPSLGINAQWVGGHLDYGYDNPTYYDAFGRFYVTRMSEVNHPERLLVFTSARGKDPDLNSSTYEGYFEVRSPYFLAVEGYLWSERFRENDPPGDFGFVSPRFDGRAVTAFMDNHVDLLNEKQLKDMRHWANNAKTPDYGIDLLD